MSEKQETKQVQIFKNGHRFVLRFDGSAESIRAAYEAIWDWARDPYLPFTQKDAEQFFAGVVCA